VDIFIQRAAGFMLRSFPVREGGIMRFAAALVLVLGASATTVAQPTGNVMPSKPAYAFPPNVPDPMRQGGDTIDDALVIPSLPYSDSGTTTGFHDDYAGTCIYDNGAPDVVYQLLVPAGIAALDISLCGSPYDTGLYVLDAGRVEIACDDDACELRSRLVNFPVTGGNLYYVIVDGYANSHGTYTLDIEEYVPCVVDAPAGSVFEGEPPFGDDYVDSYNGGCNTPPDFPFQDLWGDASGDLVFCGTSGWYLYHGSPQRDTDWFRVHMGSGDRVEVRADAERPTYLIAVPHDCAQPLVHWQLVVGECREGSEILDYWPRVEWVFVAPPTFSGPPGADREYDYVVWFSGLQPGVVDSEPTTWGTVKALYDR
jgi:hypothetical protein